MESKVVSPYFQTQLPQPPRSSKHFSTQSAYYAKLATLSPMHRECIIDSLLQGDFTQVPAWLNQLHPNLTALAAKMLPPTKCIALPYWPAIWLRIPPNSEFTWLWRKQTIQTLSKQLKWPAHYKTYWIRQHDGIAQYNHEHILVVDHVTEAKMQAHAADYCSWAQKSAFALRLKSDRKPHTPACTHIVRPAHVIFISRQRFEAYAKPEFQQHGITVALVGVEK